MINHWMFRCKDVSRKVSLSMDIRLPFYERLAVAFHLLMCRYCARFSRQLRQLRKMSGQVDADIEGCEPTEGLSEDCKNRLKQALRRQV
jgi:hypothetical protein